MTTANNLAGLINSSTGNIVIPTSNAGINFNNSGAIGAATLNDYEVGSWTPSLAGTTLAPTISSYTARYGYYIKVGQTVWLSGYMYCNGTMSGGSGNLLIGGIPFTIPINTNAAYQFAPVGYFNYNGSTNPAYPARAQATDNQNYLTIFAGGSQGVVSLPNSSSTIEISFTGVFKTNS